MIDEVGRGEKREIEGVECLFAVLGTVLLGL